MGGSFGGSLLLVRSGGHGSGVSCLENHLCGARHRSRSWCMWACWRGSAGACDRCALLNSGGEWRSDCMRALVGRSVRHQMPKNSFRVLEVFIGPLSVSTPGGMSLASRPSVVGRGRIGVEGAFAVSGCGLWLLSGQGCPWGVRRGG